jgi:beta-glucosidase
MNGTSANSKVVSITPWWQPVLYSTIALFSLLTLLSIAMLTKTKLQNNRKKDEKEA